MKPLSHAIFSVLLAGSAGFGGYFLGQKRATKADSSGQSTAATITKQKSLTASGSKDEGKESPMETEALLAALDAETDPLARYALAMKHLEAWVAKNPTEALNWLNRQQPSARRNELIRLAVNQFGEKNPKEAVAWAEKNLTGVELNNSLIELSEAWAQQDGLAAADWFLSRPATQQRDAAIENVFFAWAGRDPQATLAFVQGHPELAQLSAVVQRAAYAGWSKGDPLGAVTASLATSRTQQDPSLFATTLANWATIDLPASSQWLLTSLPAGAERTAAVSQLATIYAQQSPQAGANWLGNLATGPERETATNQFANAWSTTDAPAAARWATSQTTVNISPEVGSELAHNYLMADPSGFNNWVATLPDGPLKTQATQMATPVADTN
jgi:hypothetical protein